MEFAVKVQRFDPTASMEAAGETKLRPHLKTKAKDYMQALMEKGVRVTISAFIGDVTGVMVLQKTVDDQAREMAEMRALLARHNIPFVPTTAVPAAAPAPAHGAAAAPVEGEASNVDMV